MGRVALALSTEMVTSTPIFVLAFLLIFPLSIPDPINVMNPSMAMVPAMNNMMNKGAADYASMIPAVNPAMNNIVNKGAAAASMIPAMHPAINNMINKGAADYASMNPAMNMNHAASMNPAMNNVADNTGADYGGGADYGRTCQSSADCPTGYFCLIYQLPNGVCYNSGFWTRPQRRRRRWG